MFRCLERQRNHIFLAAAVQNQYTEHMNSQATARSTAPGQKNLQSVPNEGVETGVSSFGQHAPTPAERTSTPDEEVLSQGGPDEIESSSGAMVPDEIESSSGAMVPDEEVSPVNYDEEGLGEVELDGVIYRFDSGKQGTALCLSSRTEENWRWRFCGELRWDGRDLRSKALDRKLLAQLSLHLRQLASEES